MSTIIHVYPLFVNTCFYDGIYHNTGCFFEILCLSLSRFMEKKMPTKLSCAIGKYAV
jgi:predicted Co/Zn/Cd cation transporter (cation efflux family)